MCLCFGVLGLRVQLWGFEYLDLVKVYVSFYDLSLCFGAKGLDELDLRVSGTIEEAQRRFSRKLF